MIPKGRFCIGPALAPLPTAVSLVVGTLVGVRVQTVAWIGGLLQSGDQDDRSRLQGDFLDDLCGSKDRYVRALTRNIPYSRTVSPGGEGTPGTMGFESLSQVDVEWMSS